ncbi:DUF397 domain-containing protein [Amycolatopsis samaneae]|uniref:DUF397 domain-containing protein n=1 Tax=Amycolatopsis samaneae TaxID=664691 RepID=A0ABW5GAN7_9PSEU
MNTENSRPTLIGVPGWRKSSRSRGANGCVELNTSVPGYAGVRDSKLGEASPILVLEHREMRAFLHQIKNGGATPA